MVKPLPILAAALLIAVPGCPAGQTAMPAAPRTVSELKQARIKTLVRRDPRARGLIEKIESKIAPGRPRSGEPEDTALGNVERAFYQIVMSSGALSEERLHAEVDLLEEMAGPFRQPGTQELKPLQDRYARVCALLEDQILIKDLEPALSLHDNFVRHTAMGLWDAGRIESELSRIEESVSKAPPIPYGRSELLRDLEGKRLAPPAKGSYVGVYAGPTIFPGELQLLSTQRPSLAVLGEATGGLLQADTADVAIQGPDGELLDLDRANRPDLHQPFSPPTSLWMKARLLEGHVPFINFDLPSPWAPAQDFISCYSAEAGKHEEVQSPYPCLHLPRYSLPPGKLLMIEDVLDGKLDEYFRRNLKIVASTRAPVCVGLFDAFDGPITDTAFGADGRTAYYLLVDPKLSRLSGDKLQQEATRRMAKGRLAGDAGAELRRYYGDPSVPDGPERVRDAWKHVRQLATAVGANAVSFYACAGPCHGNKKGLGSYPYAGAQDWNKLDYYYPGDGVMDWIGVSGAWIDAGKEARELAFSESVLPFLLEARSTRWNATPSLIRDLAPAREDPIAEPEWISACLQGLLPGDAPDLKAVFLRFPEELTLWSAESLSAYRRAVSSNPSYKHNLNLKPAQSASTP